MLATPPDAGGRRSGQAGDGVLVRVVRSGEALATDVRTARSLWARFMGLMGRRALAPGEGLWLPTDASIHMLFMRFPIDAVFLAPADGAGPGAWRVIAIRERLRPWTGVVWFVRGARGCLELEAGAAARVGLRAGDTVRFEAAAGGSPESGAGAVA
jgi:uncharacterized membrane protein (UPF0127 family)